MLSYMLSYGNIIHLILVLVPLRGHILMACSTEKCELYLLIEDKFLRSHFVTSNSEFLLCLIIHVILQP